MSSPSCNTCCFQHTEICPQQFGNTPCEKYLARTEKVHQPPHEERHPKPWNHGKTRISIYHPKPPDTRPVKLQNGQKLYYEDGGEVKEGLVFKISQDTFWFMTEGEKRELVYAIVGEQLFFTRKGAEMKKHR